VTISLVVISFLLLAGLQNPGVEQITAAHTVRYWGLLHTHGGERKQREQVVSEVRFARNAYHSAWQGRAWLLPRGLQRAREIRDIVAAFGEFCSEQPDPF